MTADEDQAFDEAEAFLKPSLDTQNARIVRYTKPDKQFRTICLLNTAWAIFTAVALAALLLIQPRGSCIQRNSSYSPALAALDDSDFLVTAPFTNNSSPFRGGSDESERYWRALMKVGVLDLAKEDFIRAGTPDEQMIELPAGTGTGYMGYMHYLHEIHCLYKIHQYLHEDYYQSRGSDFFSHTSRAVRRDHVEHCIEFLRASSLCHVDTSLMTFVWSDRDIESNATGASSPAIDGQDANSSRHHGLPVGLVPKVVPRKCRDWKAVQRWALAHQATAAPQGLRRPENTLKGMDKSWVFENDLALDD